MQGPVEKLSTKDGSAGDDLALLDAATRGDRAAFAAFVRRHEGAVRRYARGIVGDVDAADATQDTFLLVWRSLAAGAGYRAEGGASPRAWLFTIARHAAWRRTRKKAGEPPVHEDVDAVVDADLGCAAGWGQSPEAVAAAAESRARVRAALLRLPDADRELLALRDFADVSGADVAAAIGISVAAEKSRLHRARLLLLAALREGGTDA